MRMRAFAERFIEGNPLRLPTNYCSLLFDRSRLDRCTCQLQLATVRQGCEEKSTSSLHAESYRPEGVKITSRKAGVWQDVLLWMGGFFRRGLKPKVAWRREMPLTLLHNYWALWDCTDIESDRASWPNPDGFPSCRTVTPVTCSFGASHTRYYFDLDNA